jgi:hypothetical protein
MIVLPKRDCPVVAHQIARLREKREDLEAGERPAPSTYFEKLNLHPRIADVARDLFVNGHDFEAVFAGAKAPVLAQRAGIALPYTSCPSKL